MRKHHEPAVRSSIVDTTNYHQIQFPPDLAFVAYVNVSYRALGYDSNLMGMHRHDCFEVGYCHEGRGFFKIAGKMLSYRAGDMVVINPSEPHIAYFSAPSVWTWLYFDPVKLLLDSPSAVSIVDTTPFGGDDFVNVLAGRRHGELAEAVRNLIRECQEKRPHFQAAIRAMVSCLMIYLHRELTNSTARQKPAAQSGATEILRIRPALEYMHEHYHEKITIGQLARLTSISAAHFRRVFKRTVGKAPHDYLSSYRIGMAARLMEDASRSVKEIAAATGFDDLSSFCRAFKLATGVPPAGWRKGLGKT